MRDDGPDAFETFATSRVWMAGVTVAMLALPPVAVIGALTADGGSVFENPLLLGLLAIVSPFLSIAMLRQVYVMGTAPFVLRVGPDGVDGYSLETRFWSRLTFFSLDWSELREVTTFGGLGSSLTLTDKSGRSYRFWATMVKGVKSSEAQKIADVVEGAWPD